MSSEEGLVRLADVLALLNSLYDEHDGIRAAENALEEAVAEVRALPRHSPEAGEERLREALEKLAVHGIPNIDHNPTRIMHPEWRECDDWWQAYFLSANELLQEYARAALRKGSERAVMCEECDAYLADPPSKLCSGCEAYREHQA